MQIRNYDYMRKETNIYHYHAFSSFCWAEFSKCARYT